MLTKIFVTPQAVVNAKNHKRNGEQIILAGGCFDLLHIGHLKFLENAKKFGGKLFVMLESDKKVSELKGPDRPVFSQDDRAEALAHVKDVDVVIKLPYFADDRGYKKLVMDLSPDIIAITENDPKADKKKMQANSLGAKIEVIKFVKSLSSSHIAEILMKEKHF